MEFAHGLSVSKITRREAAWDGGQVPDPSFSSLLEGLWLSQGSLPLPLAFLCSPRTLMDWDSLL